MKHAFLITAYNNFENLSRLLELLDDDRCSVFLHVDAKANQSQTWYTPKYAKLYILPSMNVRWGHVSLVKCTLNLIEQALEHEWDYCHYLSESDMLLKTVDEIDQVFQQNNGKEFIDFAPEHYGFAHYKCDVYHFFNCFPQYRKNKFLRVLNHGLAKVQWHIGYRRRDMDYYHGSAFFSITRQFATYVCKQRSALLNLYAYTLAPDEVWLQTLCMHSDFREAVYKYESLYTGNLRYIDWSRREGNSPYTFRNTDLEDLIHKGNATEICFARKFSANSSVAKCLQTYLLKKGGRI